MRAIIAKLEEEKNALNRTIERVTVDYKKSQREELSAMYSKVRELELEIEMLYQEEGKEPGSKKDKKEDELRAKHYRKLLTQKDEEITSLRKELTQGNPSDYSNLREEIKELKEENEAYSEEIAMLKKELDTQEKFFQGEQKRLQQMYKSEIESTIQENVIPLNLTDISQRRTLASDSDSMMLEAAKEKVHILELELKLQDDHFKKTIKGNEEMFSSLKTKIVDLTKENEILKKNLEKSQSEVREVKTKAFTFEKPTKDIRMIDFTQRAQNNIAPITREIPTIVKELPKKQQKEIELTEVFSAWKRYYDDDKVRCDLLLKVMQNPSLKAECLSGFLQQYLLMLYQCFSSEKPLLYETATVCLSELVESKRIDVSEFKTLSCEGKVINTLVPQRADESEAAAINRHVSAISVLAYMDNLNIEWTKATTDLLVDLNGIETFKFYIENYLEFEGIAVKASQVAAYIGSYKENLDLLRESGILNGLLNILCQSHSIELKRNVSECLAILIKDAGIRKQLEQDERVAKLLLDLAAGPNDIVYQENLLLCFVNLTVSKVFKTLLYDDGIIEVLLEILNRSEKSKEEASILYSLKIAANISYPDCPAALFTKLLTPVIKILRSAKGVDTIVQGLVTIQKMVEDDAGKNVKEYNKLLEPILTFIRSVDDDTIYQAQRVLLTLFKHSGGSLLNQAVTSEEPIKASVLLYCTHTNPLMISLNKNMILGYARSGYGKVIGKIGKITLLEKLFADIRMEETDAKKESLEVLAHLAGFPENRENICNIKGIKEYVTKLIEMITAPAPLSTMQE